MKTRLFLLFSSFLIIVLAVSLFALLYQNGSSEFFEPPMLTEPPPVLWQIDLEHFATDFVVYGGRVFACDHWGNVLAFDAANGKLLWNKHVGGYVAPGPSLTVYDGKPYYGSRGSVVYRLDPNTGSQELSYEAPVSSSYRSKAGPDFFVADGKVFATADGIAVYNADDGELFWERPFNVIGITLGNASASTPEIDYVFMRSSSRVNPNNGSRLWDVKGRHSEPLVITQSQVIFWNYDANNSAGGQTVLSVNASSGEPLWSFDVGAPVFQPTEHNGFLFFGTYDGDFYALDAQNGTVGWKTSVDPQNIMHRQMFSAVSPVVIDSETQSVLWSYTCNQLDLGMAGGQVQYVGVICNLDLNTGELEYTNQFQGNGTITNETNATPLLGLASLNDTIYLTAGTDLWILDQSTGNSLGMRHFEHYLHAPVAYRTRVYFATDLFLFAYE